MRLKIVNYTVENPPLLNSSTPYRKSTLFFVYILAITYGTLWLYIGYLRLISFNNFYGDLGQQTSYLIALSNTSNLYVLFHELRPQSPFAIVIAQILRISPYPLTLIALQDYAISLSIVPLYYVSKAFLRDRVNSWLMVISYLLFFPLSATLWEGYGHIMEFFPLLFFIALYLYIRGSKFYILFFALASYTDIVMSTSLILLLFYDIFKLRRGRLDIMTSVLDPAKRIKYNIVTILVSLFPIAYYTLQQNLFYIFTFGSHVYTGTSGTLHPDLLQAYISIFTYTLVTSFLTLLLIFIPFLILIRYPNKFLITLIPFFYFFFFSGYESGFFNFLFYIWSMYTPLVFSALLIYMGSRRPKTIKDTNFSVHKNHFCFRVPRTPSNRAIALMITLVIITISIFYAPWGPLNSQNIPGQNVNAFYSFETNLHVSRNDIVAANFVSLVPTNKTILIQNNMPIFSDRDRNFLFGPSYTPWVTGQTQWGPAPANSTVPQFICTDPISYWFTSPFTSGENMSYWFHYFTTKYHYGLLAESYPYYLYELNYNGTPKIMITSF